MTVITNYVRKSFQSNSKRLSTLLHGTRSFSEFQDYDDACTSYDVMRRAVAVDKIDDAFKLMHSRKYVPVSSHFNHNTISTLDDAYTYEDFKLDLRVLDAGCGTGNYIKAMYDLGVGALQGMDLSQGMLSKCIHKFKSIETNILNAQSIRLCSGNLNDSFPYKSNAFDAVLLSQVLHHVVNTVDDEDLENIENVLRNCHQILNENGAIIITTSTPIQLQCGSWFAQFFPRAIQEMIEKHADLEWWYDTLHTQGFSNIHSYRIMDIHATSNFLNIEGIFDAGWRKCDSLFGLVTDAELKIAQNIIKTILSDQETKQEFVKQCEEARTMVGHSIALIAFKE